MPINDLHERLLAFPDSRLTFCGRDGSTMIKRYGEVYRDVTNLMAELRDCRLASRDVLGLLGENSYEWVVADLAILGIDCVSVAFPVEIQKELTVASLLDRYDLSALLLTEGPVPNDGAALSVAALDRRPIFLSKRARELSQATITPDVFSVAFSSGTSGRRKGLLMTKSGIENTIITSAMAWDVGLRDNILIAMPFTNFQQRYLLYLAIWSGSDISVIAPERMFQRMRDLSPTIILGPPSFFEVLENRLSADVLWRKIPLFLATVVHAVLPTSSAWEVRRTLCRRWTGIYGPRVRLMFVGSAPTRTATVKLFHRMGIPLFEGYGLTEFGWIALNLPGEYRIGSVGRPVKGVQIEMGDDGEFLVRSVCPQSTGYVFEGTEELNAVFLPHRMIATGDLGRRDDAGFLYLCGRKKNVIVTRSGLKINPEAMEAEIEDRCHVARAIIIANPNRPVLGCVVWLDDCQSAEQRQAISAFVDAMNRRRAASHYIGNIAFRPAEELRVESGLLTTNYKVNRAAVIARLVAEKESTQWAAN